jgi:hypothetical protein
MSSVTSGAPARAKESRRFFERQLAGEEPLSFETGGLLYQLGVKIHHLKPWEFLEDQEWILLKEPRSQEICYCSILGALGTIFSVQVYVGAESYRLLRKMAGGAPLAPGDVYASMAGVSAEFVLARDRTPADRELLEAFGHVQERGGRAPIFRAFRPGYHPWYITEGEGRLLVHCLQGVLALFEEGHEKAGVQDYWQQEDTFPMLVPNSDAGNSGKFELRLVNAPEPPSSRPKPASVDEEQIQYILQSALPKKGSMEADQFFTLAEIGE